MHTLNSELVILVKEGDEKAFGIIFHAYYSALVHFANAYIHDREASRGIVQSVFLKLWEKRALLKETENLKSFLYTLTRNESVSYLRHLKAGQRFASKTSEEAHDFQLNLDALNNLDFSNIDLENIERIIAETIETLPDRCREVFMMSRYENMKNPEIAEKLQISVKAVEANMTRALKIFRENLKDYLPAHLIPLFLKISQYL